MRKTEPEAVITSTTGSQDSLPTPNALRGAGTAARRAWQTGYVQRLLLLDLLCGTLAAASGYLIRFGPDTRTDEVLPPSTWLTVLLPVVWVGAMYLSRAYEPRFLWVGPEEFRRVTSAAVALLAAVGTVSWALRLDVARGLIIASLPLAALLTLGSRYAQRRWLHRQRVHGRFEQTTVIVGHRNGIAALHEQIRREGYHGYRVIGCFLPRPPHGDLPATFDGLPVLGTTDDVADAAHRLQIDTVAVLPSPELDGPALRRLGWQLERTSAELLLAPAVTEIAGPRVNIRPVCGLPLLHMERPELRGLRRLVKETTDRSAALVGVLLTLPLLLAIAIAVRATSPGPVLFRQERVGRDGKPFTMLKFRSMVAGADRMDHTLAATNDGNGVLFKLREDPRVTSVGKVLRRYSLDELPQLFNILRGDMSLVGPRPPLAAEVDNYGVDMHRRFIVKPGLTGLWQVSGRSDLSWDDSVRIDIRYVENWSLSFDFMILWKTLGAIARGSGAY